MPERHFNFPDFLGFDAKSQPKPLALQARLRGCSDSILSLRSRGISLRHLQPENLGKLKYAATSLEVSILFLACEPRQKSSPDVHSVEFVPVEK